jgi:putative membrane protein
MTSPTNTRRAHQIQEASFDPRLKTYSYVTGILFFIITIVGIVLLPFWLIFGKMYINRFFDSLYCELTTRALHFKKGVIFQTERTVPLDKIQDLTFKEGPLLRYLGLSSLQVETAGQSAQGGADMTLTGIIDSRRFRELVLDQRDEITGRDADKSGGNSPLGSVSTDPAAERDELMDVLRDIRNMLQKIEQKTGK